MAEDVAGGAAATAARLVAVLLLAGSISSASAEWRWSGKAGLNYDFISHDYYLRAIDTLGITPDSLAEIKGYSDRIEETGINLRLELQNQGAVTIALANNSLLSNEKLRNVTTVRVQWGALRFVSDAELKSYGQSDDFSLYQSRLQNSSRLGLQLLDNSRWEVEISQEFEYTGFDERSAAVYGYRQHESRLRLTRHLAEFSDLRLNLRYDRRDAYDSSSLDFSRWMADAAYDDIGAGRSIMASLYAERKNSVQPGHRDDYYYVNPYLDLVIAFTDNLELAPRVEGQIFSYDAQSLATYSHYRLLTRVKLDYHYSLLSTFSFGLGGERLRAFDARYGEQDYRSSQLLLGYETLASTWFTLNLDSQWGYRNFTAAASEFYTDHWFVRLDLLGDIKLSRRLRFALIGGTDFEYHDAKEDDVVVYMLSGNLNYLIK